MDDSSPARVAPLVEALACRAVAERRLLMFGYRDRVRVVEPHLVGVNTAGHLAMSAWLRAGHSRATPEGGWRMYLLGDLDAPQLLDETFAGAREGWNPDDPHFAEIRCRLATP